jgi:hypothetical protein
LKTKQIKTALTSTRYRSLAFGNNAENLCAAYKLTQTGQNFICILNKNNFVEILQTETPQNATIVSLCINEQGNMIAASLLSDDGISLQTFDIKNKKWNILIEQSFASIANISFYGDDIIFDSGVDGVDNLYKISTSTKKIQRLTNSQFGAITANHNNNGDLLYSEYYNNGLKIAKKIISKDENIFENFANPYKFELAETVAAQENFVIDTVSFGNAKTYETTRYNKTENLFRVRSWLPFYAGLNPDEFVVSSTDGSSDEDEKLRLGATILSQNLLGNARAQLAYSYNDNYSAIHAGFTYTGWFPVISIEGHYGGGKNLLVRDNTISSGNENRFNIEATAYVPLNFSNARYSRGIVPSLKFSVSNSKYFVPSEMTMRQANFAEYSLSAYSYKRLAKSDIFPKWGLILNLQYKNSPFDTENFGSFYGGRITAYAPGLFMNHGLRLSALYQQQNIARYIYSTIYDFPREINNGLSRKMLMFSSDYTFPIAYPDLNIGALTYITRIRANLFYDFARNKSTNYQDIYSYGIDILFDAHWLRTPYPVTLGLRTYKTNINNNFGVRLIAGIGF